MEAKPLGELTAMLKRLDPKALEIVDLKNPRRVLRALEVITFTGRPFSAQRQKARSKVEALMIGISRPREELYRRINEATERMIEEGWADEIRRLHEQGIAWDAPAMTSIGYRELGAYVRGECLLEEAIAKTKQATRQYAKRQMTWFRHQLEGEVLTLDATRPPEEVAAEIAARWRARRTA
jgi:tRNA dimethylallyltransferase